MHISWALVLGAAALWLFDRSKTGFRWSVALSVVVWTLLPGPLSPAYWLGLAFQSPSLTSLAVCLMYGAQPLRKRVGQVFVLAWAWAWGVGIVLGWVLLADMLAWWPVSIYAWGFHPMALATVCALVMLLWLTQKMDRSTCALLSVVLVLFVITRLPSGNVWDAVLDPWLWMVLQFFGLQRAWRFGLVKKKNMLAKHKRQTHGSSCVCTQAVHAPRCCKGTTNAPL
jgi:hypothetical protein